MDDRAHQPAACPVCGGARRAFWEQPEVPATSNILFRSAAEARSAASGALRLAWCTRCELVSNERFDPSLTDTAEGYEETQAHSPTFRAWLEGFAGDLARRHGLTAGMVVDVGCGRGDFLASLCARTGCSGLGIDPSSTAGRVDASSGAGLTFQRARLEDTTPLEEVALASCRHTLEHVADPLAFLTALHGRLPAGTPLVLEVPDASRVLAEGAFWDVYHEHAHYFTATALEQVAARAGFACEAVERVYGDQNLVLHGCATSGPQGQPAPVPPNSLGGAVAEFQERAHSVLDATRREVEEAARRGVTAILWGAGSKATGFLVATGLTDSVRAVADINPDKQGSFVAGTGHPVVGPAEAAALDQGLVVVMNPLYLEEVRADLAALGCRPRLTTLGGPAA